VAESHVVAALQTGCPEQICSTGAAALRGLGSEVRVAHGDEIAPGTGRIVDVDGTPVALFSLDGIYWPSTTRALWTLIKHRFVD